MFGSQQTVVIGRIDRFDFEEPACAVRIAVGSFRSTWQIFVDGNDFACNRCVHVGRGFYRLNHTGLLFSGKVRADFGQLDEHDVAQQLLRVVGNADGNRTVFFKAQPFMAGNVFQFGRDVVAHGLILH
ncbi:hypothetical protein NM271_2147 [Neisseria meningitidis NM271]|nr:hypothetical protein NM271_2147 [Neisseria meningitidis NM271]EOC68020.1 hypothetical protein NM3144_2144 [Neisseria meningitidis NM3144]